MKIRSDFVTNSSCSSYVSVHIESRKLAEIMEKWKDKLDETQYGPVDVKDGVSFGSDDAFAIESPPTTKDSMVQALIEFLEEYNDLECFDPGDGFEDLIQELKENEKTINDSITSLEWEQEDAGWGGDSDTRLYYDYDDDFIRQFMKIDKDAEITEEIRERFRKRVEAATSIETRKATYDGKKFNWASRFKLSYYPTEEGL